MSTTELKSALNALINKTNDSSTLNEIHKSISTIIKRKKTSTLKLSASEKKAVDESIESVKKGNVYSHDKVMAEMKKKYPSLHK